MKAIIAVVGMAGAGKTEAATFFKEKGFIVLRFGVVIDDGLKQEGLSWTAASNEYYRKKIRQELGMAAVAIKMMPKIKASLKEKNDLILDGLYSWEEYIYLKDCLPNLFILCIYTQPLIRYARLSKRKDRPFTREEAQKRDITEIEVINKGGPIARADYLIKNETTKIDFYKKLEVFLTFLRKNKHHD